MIGPAIQHIRAMERAEAAHLIAEGHVDINDPSAQRRACQNVRQIRFARNRRGIFTFETPGRVVMALITDVLHDSALLIENSISG